MKQGDAVHDKRLADATDNATIEREVPGYTDYRTRQFVRWWLIRYPDGWGYAVREDDLALTD